MRSTPRHYCLVVENIDWGRSVQGAAGLLGPQGSTKRRPGTGVGSDSNHSREIGFMGTLRTLLISGFLLPLLAAAPVKKSANAPFPAIPELVREVRDRQYQSDALRENYAYTSQQTTQDIDAKGQVKKSETIENQVFFVNSHVIERTVKKNGKPLDDHDQQKVAEHVTKLVEKAEKTPPGQPLEGLSTNISRIPEIICRMLDVMEVRNPRRVNWHNRPTIVFDFAGRKDFKTHGLAEDTSKELQGTIWIDEADRQVAHLEVSFNYDFRVAGGLVASIEKGSSFHFDQVPVNGELWLPAGGEGAVQARVLMVKSYHQHFFERDYDYKRLRIEGPQLNGARVGPKNRP